MHALLPLGQDLGFLLPLEGRQFGDGVGDDAERGLDLGLGDDEGWGQTDDVLVGGFGL